MATPLIQVIEECESDIARFMEDLDKIIKEADADGFRDEDEKKEIKNFEDSIAELEKFTKDKRAEFEKNKAEWEGISSKVSGLANDYQTLVEWGEPDLQVVDGAIGNMHAHEKDLFYRDAINSYNSAQELIDPLYEEYRVQSAAADEYDKERVVAEQRIRENKDSEAADSNIIAQLEQLETDLASAHAMTADLNFTGARDAIRATVTRIETVEKAIEDNEKTVSLINGAYTDLVKQHTAARDKCEAFPDLVETLAKDFGDAAKTFGELVEKKELSQAEALINQTGIAIDATLAQLPARQAAAEAEQKKAEEQEALLRAERDELAKSLSAAAPQGTLWKLYEWKNGDTFDKLAKDSKVKDASVISGYPNNKKAADYYASNKELPIGTLVCVLDPTVKIYHIKAEGQDVYLTENGLAEFTAENTKVMSAISAHVNGWFVSLEENNKLAYDARHMGSFVTRYMSGWDLTEPAKEREAARRSVSAIQRCFVPDAAPQFAELALQAFKDLETYKAALLKWIAEMQVELHGSMESLEFWDKTLKTVVVVCVVTVAAPASISVGALYTIGSVGSAAVTAGGTAFALSVGTDLTKVITAKAIGVESNITFGDSLTRAIKAGLTTGLSAAVFGGIFSKIGPALASRIGSSSIIQAQAGRLISNPFWYAKIVDFVKFNAAALPIIEKAGGTIPASVLAPAVTPVIMEGYLKLFGRIAWGESVALRNYIAKAVVDFINGSPDVLELPTEDAAAEKIADGVLDAKTIDGIFDTILEEHQVDLEKILADDIKNMNLQALE